MPRSETAKRRDEHEVEFARIVAFSDGVFAIAITLLVLGLSVPPDLHGKAFETALWDQRDGVFAYALSFAVIGRFWITHHTFFSEVTRFDGRLLSLNLFYLAWIVLIPFSSQVLGDHGSEDGAVILYALNLAGVVLVNLLMMTDARRAGLTKPDTVDAREGRRRALVVAIVFLISIPVALVSVSIAELIWLYLFIEPIVRRTLARRKRAAGPSAGLGDEGDRPAGP